jgi:hypothetical protein
MNNGYYGSCSGVQARWKRAEKLRSIVETETATVEQTLFELTGMTTDEWTSMSHQLE